MRRTLVPTVATALLATIAAPATADEQSSVLSPPQVDVDVQDESEGMVRAALTVTLPDGDVARGLMFSWAQDDLTYGLRPQLAEEGYGTASWADATSDVDWEETVAVFNGGYWLPDGTPNGPWADEGQVTTLHSRDGAGTLLPLSRGTAVFDAEGGLHVGRWAFTATLQAEGETFDLALERPPLADGIALLTGEPSDPALHLHPLSSLTVGTQALQHSGPEPERPSPAYLAAYDRSLLDRLVSNPDALLTLTLSDLDVRARHFLPGAPLLLQGGLPTAAADGSAQDPDQAEHLSEGHRNGRHPRTVLAAGSGRIMLLAFDGRQPGWSAGLSLPELVQVLLVLGAEDAVNLDGGGSTRVSGPEGDMNRPSNPGRHVANTLRIERRIPTPDPDSSEVSYLGRPSETVVWCGSGASREPFAYAEGVWTSAAGRFATHVDVHLQYPQAVPVCAETSSGMLLLLWSDGVYHAPDRSFQVAWPGWEPLVEDVDGDGYEDLAARRGRLLRWQDAEGVIRMDVLPGRSRPGR